MKTDSHLKSISLSAGSWRTPEETDRTPTAPGLPSKRRHRGVGRTQPFEVMAVDGALLKVSTVGAVTGLSSSSIYRKLAAGEFPEPVRIGARCTRWRSADVRKWLAAQGPIATTSAK